MVYGISLASSRPLRTWVYYLPGYRTTRSFIHRPKLGAIAQGVSSPCVTPLGRSPPTLGGHLGGLQSPCGSAPWPSISKFEYEMSPSAAFSPSVTMICQIRTLPVCGGCDSRQVPCMIGSEDFYPRLSLLPSPFSRSRLLITEAKKILRDKSPSLASDLHPAAQSDCSH